MRGPLTRGRLKISMEQRREKGVPRRQACARASSWATSRDARCRATDDDERQPLLSSFSAEDVMVATAGDRHSHPASTNAKRSLLRAASALPTADM